MVKSTRLTVGALAWNSCCFVPSTMYYDYLNFELKIRNFNAFLSPVHCRGDYWRTTSMHVRYKLSDVMTGSSEGKKCQTTSEKSWKTYWITYDIFSSACQTLALWVPVHFTNIRIWHILGRCDTKLVKLANLLYNFLTLNSIRNVLLLVWSVPKWQCFSDKLKYFQK